MFARTAFLPAFAGILALASAMPAAADDTVVITHAKALAGSVTQGDAPGYPVTLSKAGSYRVESNLTPPANKDGIEITAQFVTIDMNGFALRGGNNAANGIVGDKPGARIENGTVTGFKANGISSTKPVSSWTIENMLVTGNGGLGIIIIGEGTRVLNSNVSFNVYDGITCTVWCHVEGNTVIENGQMGADMGTGTLLGNTIAHNGSYGANGNNLGYGNNTIADNNEGGTQTDGTFIKLFPNACYPTACP